MHSSSATGKIDPNHGAHVICNDCWKVLAQQHSRYGNFIKCPMCRVICRNPQDLTSVLPPRKFKRVHAIKDKVGRVITKCVTLGTMLVSAGKRRVRAGMRRANSSVRVSKTKVKRLAMKVKECALNALSIAKRKAFKLSRRIKNAVTRNSVQVQTQWINYVQVQLSLEDGFVVHA